jgi:hypothetical protein
MKRASVMGRVDAHVQQRDQTVHEQMLDPLEVVCFGWEAGFVPQLSCNLRCRSRSVAEQQNLGLRAVDGIAPVHRHRTEPYVASHRVQSSGRICMRNGARTSFALVTTWTS